MAGVRVLAKRREHTGNRQLDAIQRARDDVADAVNQTPLMGGRLVEDIVFPNTSDDVTVQHGLGRPVRGFIVTRCPIVSSAVTIGESTTAPPDPNNQIRLRTTYATTVDIYFF